MDENPIRLKREELYRLVWAEPMREVAKRFGITDVALAKRCRRLNIPVPGRGYWAKKQHGYKVPPPVPLPQWKESFRPNIVIQKREKPKPLPIEEGSEEERLVALEKQPANQITVKQTLHNPHPLVEQTQKHLLTMKPDDKGLIVTRFRKGLELHVSKESVGRALRIMDALLKGLEARGYSTAVKEKDGRWITYANVLDENIGLGLWEAYERYERELTPAQKKEKEKYSWMHDTAAFRPTGKLSLRIRDNYGTTARDSWTDSDKKKLEDRLNAFVIALIKTAFKEKVNRAERERRQKEWEEQRKRAEEWERRRREEQERIDKLDKEIAAWQRSRVILEYVQAVRKAAQEQGGTILPDSELGLWIAWACKLAERLDCSKTKAAELLQQERESRTENQPE